MADSAASLVRRGFLTETASTDTQHSAASVCPCECSTVARGFLARTTTPKVRARPAPFPAKPVAPDRRGPVTRRAPPDSNLRPTILARKRRAPPKRRVRLQDSSPRAADLARLHGARALRALLFRSTHTAASTRATAPRPGVDAGAPPRSRAGHSSDNRRRHSRARCRAPAAR